MKARAAAKQDGPPKRTERIKRVVGKPQSVAQCVILNAHRELDRQCKLQAEAASLWIDLLTVADIAYPLITTAVYNQQLIHVRNGCVSVCQSGDN